MKQTYTDTHEKKKATVSRGLHEKGRYLYMILNTGF